MFIYLYTYIFILKFLYTYTCTCVCVDVLSSHTYIYIYIYTYIHIHTSLIEIVMWRCVSETTSPEEAYVAKNLCAAPKSTGHQGIPLSFLQLPRSRYFGDARRAAVACQ